MSYLLIKFIYTGKQLFVRLRHIESSEGKVNSIDACKVGNHSVKLTSKINVSCTFGCGYRRHPWNSFSFIQFISNHRTIQEIQLNIQILILILLSRVFSKNKISFLIFLGNFFFSIYTVEMFLFYLFLLYYHYYYTLHIKK